MISPDAVPSFGSSSGKWRRTTPHRRPGNWSSVFLLPWQSSSGYASQSATIEPSSRRARGKASGRTRELQPMYVSPWPPREQKRTHRGDFYPNSVSPSDISRHVSPSGEMRLDGAKLTGETKPRASSVSEVGRRPVPDKRRTPKISVSSTHSLRGPASRIAGRVARTSASARVARLSPVRPTMSTTGTWHVRY